MAAPAFASPVEPKHPASSSVLPAKAAEEHEGRRFVELRILDQTAGQRIRLTAPMGVTLRLPDGMHTVRLIRFHSAFTREQAPGGSATAPTRSQSTEGGRKAAKREKADSKPDGPDKDQKGKPEQAKAEAAQTRDPAELPPIEDNPAVFLRVYRKGEPISQSWVFKDYPTLFQPRNVRYTFYLLDSATGGNN